MTISAIIAGGLMNDVTTTILPQQTLTGKIDASTVTTLLVRRGDSRSFLLAITESDGTTLIDLTGAVLKFAVKLNPTVTDNTKALIFKTSYDLAEIQFITTGTTNAVLNLVASDTRSKDAFSYTYDFELTRQGTFVTSAGTISVTAGSGVITGTGLDLTLVKEKDLLVPAGGPSENQRPVTITAVDAVNGNLTTDYTLWSTASGITHQIRAGDVKTPFVGTFSLLQDDTF